MKIGELAAQTGTSVDTIRYYERLGLWPLPARTEGNYRHYRSEHVERLNFIRHSRALGVSLEDVRTLLRLKDDPHADCRGVDQLLASHLNRVAQQIAALQALATQLQALRACCQGPSRAADCGILDGLAHTHERASQ